MNSVFPEAEVTDYEAHLNQISLPDKNDNHVLAAAIQAEASVIVTQNLKDFPESSLAPFGIEAIHPDDFLFSIAKQRKTLAVQAFHAMQSRLKNPPIDQQQLFSILLKNGLEKTVHLLQEYNK